MRTLLITSSSFLLCTAAALAQNQNPLQGFMLNWDRPTIGSAVSLVVRGTANAEQELCRIDRDDYRDFALNATGQVSIQGMVVQIQDDNDATRESFGLVGYQEDPARANYPDMANQRLNIANIQMPPTGATPGGVAYELTLGFNQPVTFAPGTDLFLGVALPALVAGTPPYDGLWVAVTSVNNPTVGTTTYDMPGFRGSQGQSVFNDSYLCYVINGNPVYITASATSLVQMLLDVHVAGGTVGGVALTQTNQTSYAPSNAPYATSNFLSGSHPDVTGFNAGRADDIGFGITAHTSQVATGSLGIIMMSFGPNNLGSIPVAAIAGAGDPSSAGYVCVNFANHVTFLTIMQPGPVASMLEGQLILPLSPQVRAVLSTLSGQLNVHWQGFVLDIGGAGPQLEVRASGCAVQHLRVRCLA